MSDGGESDNKWKKRRLAQKKSMGTIFLDKLRLIEKMKNVHYEHKQKK